MANRESHTHASEMKPNSTRRHFIEKIEAARAASNQPGLGGRWEGSLESLYDLVMKTTERSSRE